MLRWSPVKHTLVIYTPLVRHEKKHNPKLLSPIFSGGVGVFRVKGWGAKKFGMYFETREVNFFWRDILGFCSDILVVSEKFEKKVFNFWPLIGDKRVPTYCLFQTYDR